MLRRLNNIEKKAYYGASAALLLNLFAIANRQYLKMDNRISYSAFALSVGTLLFSAYHTPLRNIVPGLPRYGLFRRKTESGTTSKKPNTAATPTDTSHKKTDTAKEKTHRRRKSF